MFELGSFARKLLNRNQRLPGVPPNSALRAMPRVHYALLRGSDAIRSVGTRTAITCAVVYFLFVFSDYVAMAPRLRLLELGFCREYYTEHDPSKISPDGQVDESLCKLQSIQASVVNYRSWQLALNALPGLLSIPLSRRSDIHGRKPYMILALLGFALYLAGTHLILYLRSVFPTAAVFSASAFLCIGGGSPMIDTMASSIISDVSPQAHLTTRFSWLLASFFVAEIIGPAISTPLQNWNLWAPAFVGVSALIVAILLTLSCTESLHSIHDATAENNTDSGNHITNEDGLTEECAREASAPLDGSWKSSRKSTSWSSIYVGLAVFLISPLRNVVVEIMIQYASKRFKVSLGTAAYVTSMIGVYSILFYIWVLPWFRVLWQRRSGVSSVKMDYYLSVFNLAVNTLGALLIGVSQSFAMVVLGALVFTTGTGVRVTWLPVLISCVDKSSIATLCAIASIIEAFGVLGGAPLLGLAAGIGFNLPESFMGLPFFCAAFLYILGLMLIAMFKPSPLKNDQGAARPNERLARNGGEPTTRLQFRD
ncbi:MFS general substrate transporter [Coniochaeta sp. PMI_546]|nr:MFS general substrate transporter [Coniochaeta sp. PMI_546]